MRLSLLSRRRSLPLCGLFAAALLALVLAQPASAEPSEHATTPEVGTSEPSTLAGPQDGDNALPAKPETDGPEGDDTLSAKPKTGEPDGGDTLSAKPKPGEPDTPSSQPEPVYPNGEPDLDSAESDNPDEATKPAEPTVIVNIDKGTQEMTVFVDGVETYTWPVSTGIAGYSTPSGTYTATSMNKIWYSKQWDNAPMPHAVFFTKKGHAIHGTMEEKRLGNPASHGCVRLSRKNAETLFKLVEDKGLESTQVVLTGVTPGGEYKVAQPPQRQRAYPDYPGRYYGGWYGRFGYYEAPPPVTRKRRRLFQPYYDSPPQQYQPPRRKRWFRAY